jgi:hypothetical protein
MERNVMIEWLNANAGTVSGFAAVVSATATLVIMVATVVYAALTRHLVFENRLLRKAGTDPQVVGYAIINPRVYAAIDFVIRNIGKGSARNVSYRIVAGGEDLGTKEIRLPPPGIKYAFLPQDEQISVFMGMGWDLLKEPAIEPFDIEISYQDIAGYQYKERFTIDAAQFGGLHRVGTSHEEDAAKNLKTIATVMEGWAHRRLQVETMSITERQEHDQELRQRMEEMRARRNQTASQDQPPNKSPTDAS